MAALSYAKWDKFSLEIDAEPSAQVDWPAQAKSEIFLTDEQRALEARQEELLPLPPLGAVVLVDGLESAREFNGAVGVVVSAPLCGGARVAVELRTARRGKVLVARGAHLTPSFLERRPDGAALVAGRAGRVEAAGPGALWVGDALAFAVAAGYDRADLDRTQCLGLWRPLSRSDSSRFGSFLDR